MAKVKSIKELIEMKQAIEDGKSEIKSYYAKSIDTEIKYKTATRVEAVQAQEMDRQDIDSYLVYTHIVEPNLADEELQKTFNFGCPPHHIVDKLLSINEVGELSLATIGQLKPNMVKDVKNL